MCPLFNLPKFEKFGFKEFFSYIFFPKKKKYGFLKSPLMHCFFFTIHYFVFSECDCCEYDSTLYMNGECRLDGQCCCEGSWALKNATKTTTSTVLMKPDSTTTSSLASTIIYFNPLLSSITGLLIFSISLK